MSVGQFPWGRKKNLALKYAVAIVRSTPRRSGSKENGPLYSVMNVGTETA